MSDSNNDSNHAVLNLSPEEKRVFSFLFDKADVDQLGVITGERAVSFFERTGVPAQVLGEIWQVADTENRGFLSKPGFCIVLRLIGHYQAGREPSSELAFKSAPVAKFEGMQIPPPPPALASPSQGAFPPNALQPQTSGGAIRIPPLDPQKVAQYTGLFERSGAQNGLLNGLTAKAIFERAGLPVETLGKIWTLADREQRGALDQTEFIVAMHLLTSTKSRAMATLPTTLPQGFYDAAARRGAPPPPPQARQPGVAARQFTGSSMGAPVRTSSPLARPAGFGTPTPAGPAWLITPAEKAKYDQFFANIDTQGRGVLSGEQAVTFFGDSGLPEDALASIWDLADIDSEGQLNKDEFAVAMYLIKQQRSSSATPLPAFLPPALIPPSMRKANLQQQTEQTTAPAFETASEPKTMPKSAADDLFGLDEPTQAAQPILAPQSQRSVDSVMPGSPSSPTTSQRYQPHPQSSSVFKPFMPTSAFGASLAPQNTGGSQASAPSQARAMPQPSAMDDLLGDNDAHAQESSKLNNDTTELANMSNQMANLKTQMDDTQAKKSTTQAELNATSTQKQELETRLQQFRIQYEQEVRSVKEIEAQLTQSRDSTKKLGQELALLEGAYQDLQSQHQSISQALQADQTENANLKQRIGQLNAEVARLKPEIEKMKLDARQQKGMVSINKKQLTTNETEREKLNTEKTELEREAETARVASPEPTPSVARDMISPVGSTMSSTNPFFRKTGIEERSASPANTSAPTPSAFDQLFGPSFAQGESNRSPPPPTSFANRNHMTDSISSDGKLTPAATPPPQEARELPMQLEPPPLPVGSQFTPDQLPVGGLHPQPDDTLSTAGIPPASRAGNGSEIGSESAITPGIAETLPGAFPSEAEGSPRVDSNPTESSFDAAFASMGATEGSREVEHGEHPFTTSFPQPAKISTGPISSEFPPIHNLDHDESESDSDDEPGSENSFTAPQGVSKGKEPAVERLEPSTVASTASELPKINAQTSPPSYESTAGADDGHGFPKEFTGLLPAREDPTSPEPASHIEEPNTPKAIQHHQPSFPEQTPVSATAMSDVFHDASSRPLSEHTVPDTAAPKNAFDEFDEFDDLAEAQEADKSGSDFDFGFANHSRGASEFDAAFEPPAAAVGQHHDSSTTNGVTSTTSPFSITGNSSIQHTPEAKHDWDAIFSGLDNSATGNFNTSSSDPWEPTSSTSTKPATSEFIQTSKAKDGGRALTPGTEHDDPILKRLTGMGYARGDALHALEMYDYDINAAVDHLASK